MMIINKKERVIAAINHKEVDKIPTTYRGTKYISEALMKYFKIEDPMNLTKNYKKLLKKMGADFWASGSKLGKFSTFTSQYIGPKPKEPYVADGQLYYAIGINSVMGRIDKYNFEYPAFGVNPPLANIQSDSEIKKGFLASKLDLFDFKLMKNKYNTKDLNYETLKNNNEDFICMGTLSSFFMMCCYLRGMDQFLMDLSTNIKLAERIIGEVGEFGLEFNRRELNEFGEKAEYYGTWDDVAGQFGIMFSPEIFKKYFFPIYKKLIENVKQYNLFFGWHCCGSVHKALPFMIDAGIDVLDVVQTSAKDMELEKMYKLYGKDICLHGGIDAQDLLINKKPKEVREEVDKVIDLWGNRGGIILAPSHEVPPDTPIENILAIYKEINKY